MHQKCKAYSVSYGIRADLAYILICHGVYLFTTKSRTYVRLTRS